MFAPRLRINIVPNTIRIWSTQFRLTIREPFGVTFIAPEHVSVRLPPHDTLVYVFASGRANGRDCGFHGILVARGTAVGRVRVTRSGWLIGNYILD